MTHKLVSEIKAPEKKEQPKKIIKLMDSDQTEVKLLGEEDAEQAVKVLRKCSFDVTEKEVSAIISQGFSYGAYVDRMLIGVALAWPAHYDEALEDVGGGTPNAVYNEDPAILLAYEGRGVRRILLRKKEEEAAEKGFAYSVAYLYEDTPKGEVSSYIREAGSQLEKLYLSENYVFRKTKRGVLAVKTLAAGSGL